MTLGTDSGESVDWEIEGRGTEFLHPCKFPVIRAPGTSFVLLRDEATLGGLLCGGLVTRKTKSHD